jgi:hypothetical protein
MKATCQNAEAWLKFDRGKNHLLNNVCGGFNPNVHIYGNAMSDKSGVRNLESLLKIFNDTKSCSSYNLDTQVSAIAFRCKIYIDKISKHIIDAMISTRKSEASESIHTATA